jgi:hypothetical protein
MQRHDEKVQGDYNGSARGNWRGVVKWGLMHGRDYECKMGFGVVKVVSLVSLQKKHDKCDADLEREQEKLPTE